MSYIDEPRLKLISDILSEKYQSTLAFTQYMNASREYSEGESLHMREAHFLMAVGPGEGKTMSKVAEQLGVTQGAVSQTAGRLEKKGYLIRKRSNSNYRQVMAVLTDKGETFYHEHLQYDSSRFADMDEKYFSRFTDEELKQFRNYESFMCALFTNDQQ